ncbi:uncharacterized protein [Rhodnius prolixus]|uniref:uncharacterized protein n=1 Tax=Rhodnius prolixus TaxID=13249 RepID=UPI003D18BE20
MNHLISAVVIISLFAFVQCYLDLNGVCTKHEMTCSKTCTAVAYCHDDGVMPVLLDCYGVTPYCNLGKCSNSYNPYCNQAYNPLFYCPEEDGTYPDPLDCTRFHICLNRTAYTSYCNQPGLVFSTETLSCVKESDQHQCGKVMCLGNGTWVSYSTDEKYAFLCENSAPTHVRRCNESNVFNVHTAKCEFKCNKEGLFQDLSSGDPASYIECSLLYGRDYIITKRNCPNDKRVTSYFDPNTSQCVARYYLYDTTTYSYSTTTTQNYTNN